MKFMKKILVLASGFLFGAVVLLALPRLALAEENPCQMLKNCPVPAPTLVEVTAGATYYQEEFLVKGLSWNETLVDVYIDGVYNGRAQLITNESGVGHFAYAPFLSLNEGKHLVYAVARNLNERERSVESIHYEFFIIQRSQPASVATNKTTTIDSVADSPVVSSNKQPADEGLISVVQDDSSREVGVITREDEVEMGVVPKESGRVQVNKRGLIEGGVSAESSRVVSKLQQTADRETIINEFFRDDAEFIQKQQQERARQNQQVGLIMLSFVLVVALIWSAISYQRKPAGHLNIDSATKPLPEDDPNKTAQH
jgi:hypothetical protein